MHLERHPAGPACPITEITAELRCGRKGLAIADFAAIGDMSRIAIPTKTAPTRRDELWKATCFEVFVETVAGAYHEYNFSPSGAWAAYYFASYRHARANLEIAPPEMIWEASDKRLGLTAQFDLALHEAMPPQSIRRVGMTAVIEDVEGAISYWALAHPFDKPDFHHSDGFIYDFQDSLGS